MFQRTLAGLTALSALTLLTATAGAQPNQSSKDLRIVMPDVEGGAAVLFVTPEGKSLLIDTGWPPSFSERHGMPTSADRIAAAAKSLGIKKIDYLIMTHYHMDHVGGIDALLQKLPVGTFIDHGPNRQLTGPPVRLYPKYVKAREGHKHIVARVGQKLKIGSMHLEFVTSDGNEPKKPLPGAGQKNPYCANVPLHPKNGGEENARSVGTLITFGKARILDLGDLTWNKEIQLLCPVNKIGKVDVYFVTGHGMNLSSSPPTAALDPLVALMQNGPKKGGDQEVIKTVDGYPDLKGFWRAHYSVRYPDLNGDPNYIANLNSGHDEGNAISVDVTRGGKITVTNGRNHFSKTYTARAASE
jgi:beta-lactamase superfamily II metal-dependent hydrolase